jgi:hypothetical protein
MTSSSEAEAFAAETLAAPSVTLEPIRRGANAKVWCVRVDGEPAGALKSYPAPVSGGRDRFASEVGALSFLAEAGERQVPTLLRADPDRRLALLSWVPGAPGPTDGASADDIDQAVAFVARLREATKRPEAQGLPEAAEACLSTAEIFRQIDRRHARLAEVEALSAGLSDILTRYRDARSDAETAWTKIVAIDPDADPDADADLPASLRTLSPSDFGFHNAVRDGAIGHGSMDHGSMGQGRGALVFLDFEYFGWDDPVKLAVDFELHPGMTLEPALISRWHAGLAGVFGADDPGWDARVAAWRPLLGLRWTLILLNEFLPERWRHRVEAGETRDRDGVLQAQLAKADAMLSRVLQAQRAL